MTHPFAARASLPIAFALLALFGPSPPNVEAKPPPRRPAVAPEERPEAERPRLDLLFVQPDIDFLDRGVMGDDLDRAVRAGATEVIVQYLAHGDSRLPPRDPTHPDPVVWFLDLAQERGLKVWLGTWELAVLWRREIVPLKIWRRIAELGAGLIEDVAARYHDHPAFAGWYWTPEAVWPEPPSESRLESLTWTTKKALMRIRAASPDAPVAIVLGPSFGEANLLSRSWCRYIEATAPERVVVMDGVGMGHLDASLAGALYEQVGTCARRAGAIVVADIELFGPADLGLAPGRERLQRQYDEARAKTPIVGAFDLNHHLRPDTPGDAFVFGPVPEPATSVALDFPTRNPEGAWRERAKLDYGVIQARLAAGSGSFRRLELVTRTDHPEYVVAATVGEDGALTDLGPASPTHGPGHNEVTWTWRGAEAVAPGVAFRMSTKSGTLDAVELRAYR